MRKWGWKKGEGGGNEEEKGNQTKREKEWLYEVKRKI